MLTFKFRRRLRTARIIIHSSRTDSSIKNTVAWLRVRARENGLLDVGYHFVIERDGTFEQTRPWDVMGSHAPGFNWDSIGICLAGDNDLYPTHAQVYALVELLLSYNLTNVPIKGHSEVQRYKNQSSPSPGYDLERLRADITEQLTDMNAYTDSVSHPGRKEGHGDDRALYETEGGTGASLSPQCTVVLQYLQTGRMLTNLIAITNLGVGSLSSRVAQLRAAGYNIVSTPKEDFNGRTYASYSLEVPSVPASP